jgi:hypothetical protein
VDVTEAGRKIRRGLGLWTVAVDVFKADLYRRLWLAREGTGFPVGWVHLPQWAEPEHVGSDRYGERFWNRFRREERQPNLPPLSRVSGEPEPPRPADPVTLPETVVPTVTVHRSTGPIPRASRYAR